MTAAAMANPTGLPTLTAYSLDNYVADALAVMDATETGMAILVGLSLGGLLRVRAGRAPPRTRQGSHTGGHRRDVSGPATPT